MIKSVITHCPVLGCILGICLVSPISLDCKFFEGRGNTLYALAASMLPSTVLYIFSPLAILSHPIVSIITSVWDNINICLCSPDFWVPSPIILPSLWSNYIGLFLFCEHIKLLSMLGFLYFLSSSSPRFLQIQILLIRQASAQMSPP